MSQSNTESARPGASRAGLVVASLLAALVTAVVGLGASSWIGRPFPGFLLLGNRVIASVGLPDWPVTEAGTLYQAAVVQVDGAPTAGSTDLYAHVAAQPTGNTFTYELRRGLSTDRVMLSSRSFSRADFWLVFGAYLGTGFLYLFLAIIAVALSREPAIGRALFLVGAIGGIYALSAVSIYDPGAGLHLHALAEALFPASLAYLALVLPKRRARPSDGLLKAFPWGLSLAIAIPYELTLSQPGAYSILHAVSETYLGLAGAGLIASAALASRMDPRPLLRAGIRAATFGLGVPAVMMTVSGLTGGSLPVNLCALTAFLFPTCLVYGLVRERWL